MGKNTLHELRGTPIVTTQNVAEYRAAVKELCRPDDVALELGCAGGLTTRRLASVCRLAVGVDKNLSPVCTEKQAELALSCDRLSFAAIDAFDIAAVKELQTSIGANFTVIFVDLSGNRELGTMMPLLDMYEKSFGDSCRLFCVKNYKLVKLVHNASHLPSSHNAEGRSQRNAFIQSALLPGFALGFGLGVALGLGLGARWSTAST